MSNFIPLKIINLQGQIYQVVDKENEMPVYQGSWKQCIHYIEKIVIDEFTKIALEGLSQN